VTIGVERTSDKINSSQLGQLRKRGAVYVTPAMDAACLRSARILVGSDCTSDH
jgi:hypothetical protein